MADAIRSAKEIFVQALERESPAERAAFLAVACGEDLPLLARVEALLAAHESPESLLDRPMLEVGTAPDLTVDMRPIAESPGSWIGPYKLLEKIGEGGMGLVFVAEQQQPMRRRVALKIIKPGLDTREVVARFEAERQALAMMDHPHIAKVLDGGATESGRPYFVMELVRGVPITAYCDQQQLAPRERIELFVSVCQAVQHAHHKGIIHRDIKPSNVLVTLHDGRPVVKVIDFGVAKAIHQPLTERTVYTQFSQIIGTPLYMSPEQAELSGLDVDARTDIYSLGVLLYELLTSTTPFDRRRLQQAAHDEMRRIIREEEPPRPSTRISSLGATATSVAAMRRTDPDRLTRVLRGDLDWIVMKALEKDRTRRYETASSLAEDVWRFLREEPVLARPPSPAYRFQKFARRNKVLLSTAGLVLLSMVAGMAISIWQAVRAASAEALAKERLVAESKAHQDAELARGKAERAWKRATAAEIEAEHHLLRAYLNQARSARVTQRPGQRLESLDALGKAAALAAKLGLRDELGPELRDDLIASLALPVDVREIRRWKLPHQNWFAAVDKQLQRYAYADLEGNRHLCRVQDSSEIAKVAANASPASVHRFSVDGRYLVYHVRHGANGAVWDCEAGRALLEFPLPGDLPSYDLSLDCRTLAAALTDGSIGLYDLPSGALRKTISGVGQIYSLRLDPQLPRVAVTRGRSVEIWDLEEGQRLQSFPHPFWVGRLAWRPDGKLLAVEGGDFNIHVWDVDGEREQAVLHGHINVGIEMSFSPSGRWLASCGWDGTTRIWDPLSGKSHLLAEWMCGDFSADGRHLIFRDGQHVLGIWEFVDSQECVTLATYPKRGKNQNSFAAEICAEGRLLASGGVNGLDLWDLRDGRHLGRYAIGDCYALMFNYQAKSLLTAGSRGLWRWPVSPEVDVVRIGPPIQLDSAATLGMNSASHSAANGYAARIVDSSTIKVFRINNPQEVTAVTHAGGTMVALSADGKWAATGGRVRQAGVKVWDVRNGNLAKDLWPDASDTFPKFSPDGKWLVAGSRSEYRIWSAGTWDLQVLWPREAAANTLGVAAFRADGKCLAIANTRTAVSLLEPSSGQVLASLSSPNTVENIHDLCFHPDGCSLAVVHADSIQLWDLRAIGRQLAALGLDWGLCDPSPDSAAPAPGELPALRVEVDLGPLQGASDASAATPR